MKLFFLYNPLYLIYLKSFVFTYSRSAHDTTSYYYVVSMTGLFSSLEDWKSPTICKVPHKMKEEREKMADDDLTGPTGPYDKTPKRPHVDNHEEEEDDDDTPPTPRHDNTMVKLSSLLAEDELGGIFSYLDWPQESKTLFCREWSKISRGFVISSPDHISALTFSLTVSSVRFILGEHKLRV